MKVIDKFPIEEWESLVNSVNQASFFQTPAWARILNRAYPNFELTPLLFQPDASTKILLPLVEARSRLTRKKAAYSMPFGTYGGLLSDTKDVSPYIQDIFTHLRKLYSEIFIYPAPDSRVPYSLAPFRTAATYTHILSLENGFQFIWERVFNDKCRNQIRKAEKREVVVSAEDSEESFDTYYHIYLETVSRWEKATTVYPQSLFRSIASEKSERIKLWLARIEGRAVAGALCFYGNGNLIYWSSAMLKEFAKECPNYALQSEIIKDACQNGYLAYNMGGSGDLEGVRVFKENFGPKKVEYPFYSFQSPLSKLLSSALGLLRR